MKRFVFLLSLVLICSVNLFAQSNIDSLETELFRFNGTDEEKVDLFNELAKAYCDISPDKTIDYGQQALELSQKFNYKKGEAKSLISLGNAIDNLKNHKKALEYHIESLKINEEIGYKKGIASSSNAIGISYCNMAIYVKAMDYFIKSLKIYEEIGDKKGISTCYNNISIVYDHIGHYKMALKYTMKSLEIIEETGDKYEIATVYNNLGTVYEVLDDSEKALDCYLKSFKIFTEIGAKKDISKSLNNIGNIYKDQNNYKKALGYYQRSLKIKREIGYIEGIIYTSNNIGNLYIKTQNYDKAFEYLEQGLKLAEEIEDKYILRLIYDDFSDLYSAKGNYQKAFEYHELYSEIKDSIYNDETAEKIAEIQTKYEIEDKEKENEILRKNNEIHKLELTRQRNVRDLLIIISGLIIILVLITYSRYRSKKKANIILSEKNRQIIDQKNHVSTTLSKLRETHKIIEEKTRELKKSEEQYRTLYESADDAIILIKNNRFIDCNPATEEMFGCSRDEIIGHAPYEFSPSLQPDGRDSREIALNEIRSALNGNHQFFEWVHCRLDGTPFETEVSLNRMKIGEENIVLAIVRDITERKQAEKRLKESEQRSSLLEEKIIDLHKKQAGKRRILGKSEAMKKMFATIEKVAETDAAVLIFGETGTGKESIAHAIHNASNRRDKPFGIIDCASIPAGLLESELFGYEKGAFTGAYARRKGLFETSDEGTVFLDEISELPFDLQSNLLRVLQEKDIRRVGDTKRIKVDVRVIAASNRHLKPLVETGKFREDLYYRLSVIPIEIPPLRERGDDIMLLANYFLGQFGRKRNKKGFTRDAEAALKSYYWPGNVRQLQHIIERTVILSDSEYLSAKDIELDSKSEDHLFEKEVSEKIEGKRSLLLITEQDFIEARNSSQSDIMKIVKKRLINETLQFTGNNVKEAARLLGISRETIRRIRSST